MPAGSQRPLQALYDVGNRHLKSLGQGVEAVQGDVALPSLDGAHVGAVQAAVVGQVFLRPALTASQLAYALSKSALKFGLTVGTLHHNQFGFMMP